MNKKNINNIIEMIFTILWLAEGYLQICSYTFEHKIISFVLWPAVFLGAILILFNILKYKEYLKDKKNILLILFSLSFLISSLIMYKYGIYKNVRLLIIMLFQFLILYLYNKDDNFKEVEKKIKIYLYIFLIGTFVLTFISVIHLFIGYSRLISRPNVQDIIFGFTWGRLFGAYWDPNIASVICCISLSIIIYIIGETKKIIFKILLILFAVMQLFYIVLSDSRTGRICLIVTIVSYVFLKFAKLIVTKQHKIISHFYLKMFVGVVGSLVITYSVPTIVKSTYNKIVTLTDKKVVGVIVIQENGKKEKIIEEKKMSNSKITRGYDLEGDISNRRFDIWKSGFDIFKKNMLFGVSRTAIVPYALDVMPKTYILNNDQGMYFSSMHNLYVDIIVSQGIFGIISFMSFIILSVINIIKNIKMLFEKSKYTVMFISIILTVFASTLVMTEIIYVDSPISTMFWIGLGFLNFICINKKEEKV